MAKTVLKVKQFCKPKLDVHIYTRCKRCGRPKSMYRKLGPCYVCPRDLAHAGQLSGVIKSPWRSRVLREELSIFNLPEVPSSEGNRGGKEAGQS